jgi:hypothetical protein
LFCKVPGGSLDVRLMLLWLAIMLFIRQNMAIRVFACHHAATARDESDEWRKS